MASPFCMICQGFGDSEGLLCCEAFPRGIPSAIYPWGCVSRREPSRNAKGMAWFITECEPHFLIPPFFPDPGQRREAN